MAILLVRSREVDSGCQAIIIGGWIGTRGFGTELIAAAVKAGRGSLLYAQAEFRSL
jgi:hypothetical protein